MMLKELELVNMRSHREARIAFSSGITLFEGDIGSGKSSILMAVEFALFGLGSQKPEALLTKGEGSGSVKLRFEVDGKRYEIKRQLKRSGGRVGQDKRESYLLSGSVLENLAPSELKERVLEILGFNEPKGPRAGSRIFRYAVYTPQDEMKRVLSDAKERLETVRKAFAMEAYDTARDNIKVVKGHIDMEAARLEGRFAGMSELESRVAEAKREIDGAAAGLAGAEAARDAAAADELRLRADHDRLRGREAERERLRERAGSLRGQADGAAARGESARGQAAAKSAELAELEGRIGRHAIPPRPTERDDAGIAAEIGRLRGVQEDLNGAEGRVGILRRHLADADKKLAAAADPAAEAALAAGAAAAESRAQAEAELSAVLAQADGALQASSRVSSSLVQVKTEKAQAEKELARIAGLGTKCHTCESVLTPEHVERIRGEREAAIRARGSEAARLDAEQARLDAEQAALKSRRAALEGRLEEAAGAERAAAEARQERERAAAERDSKASELARAESEAAALREMYATDRAADRFECDDADPVGYLIKLREALAERAGAQAALEAMREKAELYRGDIRARRADAQRADADAQRARSELDAAEASLGAFGGLDAELDAAASRLDGARARLRSADAEAAAHRESLGGWRRRLAADEDLLARASKSMELHKRYDAYSRWFDLYFAPSVDRIERQVLLSLQAGFDEAYQKWFDTLIDDETKTSRIDDTFMPVVDQGSYEIDAAHLSGGERTSVSLAYRLALNTLLRRETKSLRSNLIILDEPTDGFSKSQLDKVHAILRALDYEQIIVVSHDRELETHADHVFHVSKEGGVSAVRAA